MPPQPNLRLAILALGLGAFAIGTSEFAAMGLLPWYAADLGITDPQAGHVVSAYALGVMVGAPTLAIIGAKLLRKHMLLLLMALLGQLLLFALNLVQFQLPFIPGLLQFFRLLLLLGKLAG